MKSHTKILFWLIGGALLGGVFQFAFEAQPQSGLGVENDTAGVRVVSAGPKSKVPAGSVIVALIHDRGQDDEERVPILDVEAYAAEIAKGQHGSLIWHELAENGVKPVSLQMNPESTRAKWVAPFDFAAEMFLRILKLLIVPIILTSIITGVIGVGSGANLRRLGGKTFLYYIGTSTIAAITGLVLVNAIGPGEGAALGLSEGSDFEKGAKESFWGILLRMIPENIFHAFSDNGRMLQVIFFALLFGYFILKVEKNHREHMTSFFEAAFAVMMQLAKGVLALIPYGVFCLLVRVVGQTGFSVFKPLAIYMLTVLAALAIHSLVTLPLILKFVAGINPLRWARAMSPALLTAFSTSSSSVTLPVSLETVEKRGRVSNRIVSFVQPLGATINMDGTALYECIGVIFLAQYYGSVGSFDLSIADQVNVVLMALLASVGAAGIPSAGLIMMITILSSLNLPVEGAALLLAVDRPLDMLRTVVNVFSDTCGSAVVARSEGETAVLDAGRRGEPEEAEG